MGSPTQHRDEKALNPLLGVAIRGYLPGTVINTERSRVLEDGGQPDLVMYAPGRERVLIENKYDNPANVASLEKQCQGRLKTNWLDNGNHVRLAVAVLSPQAQLDRMDDNTRLVARGKPKKVALVAAMHKLLTFLNAVMRDQTPWRVPPQVMPGT